MISHSVPQDLYERPQAQGVVYMCIQAVQVHGSVDKDGNRCEHESPVPCITLQQDSDLTKNNGCSESLRCEINLLKLTMFGIRPGISPLHGSSNIVQSTFARQGRGATASQQWECAHPFLRHYFTHELLHLLAERRCHTGVERRDLWAALALLQM